MIKTILAWLGVALFLVQSAFAQTASPQNAAEPAGQRATGSELSDQWQPHILREQVAVSFPSRAAFFTSAVDGNKGILSLISCEGGECFMAFLVDPEVSGLGEEPSHRAMTEQALSYFARAFQDLTGISVDTQYQYDVNVDGMDGGQGVGNSADGRYHIVVRAVHVGQRYLWYGCARFGAVDDSRIDAFLSSPRRPEHSSATMQN